jgi:hypothetical protein
VVGWGRAPELSAGLAPDPLTVRVRQRQGARRTVIPLGAVRGR